MRFLAIGQSIRTLSGLLAFGAFLHAATLNFGPTSVPGTATIWDPDSVLTSGQLSGMGATPAILALSFSAGSGQSFTFDASGLIGCCGAANIGPDGYAGNTNITSLGSISGYAAFGTVPLVGVFTNGNPTGAAPANYDYSGGVGQASYSPLLNQVFFIGDGLTGTGSGTTQTINVPGTATELWLGIPDALGFGGVPGFYGDNPGEFSVSGTLTSPDAVPEPGSLFLAGLGFLGVIGLASRERRAQTIATDTN